MRTVIFCTVISVALSGCSLCTMGGDAATEGMRAQNQPPPQPTPTPTAPPMQPMPAGYGAMMAKAYTQMVLGMGFGMGALAQGVNYKPGEYTRWTVSGRDSTFERAYLFNDASGNAWWKLKLTQTARNETIIYEALVTADRTKVLRLRARLPNQSDVQELPVDETATVPPTAHIGNGEDKGIESVTVPAGAFSAHHMVYTGERGTADVWTTDKVPGKAIRVQAHGGRGDGAEMLLTAFGSDAKSELGTTP
ncbi:MAG: hypothetical protein JST54_32515 [Deltaproteobacteria bacterium]|nr:hypothetical protein [Deltaproteobacteria bacterium]